MVTNCRSGRSVMGDTGRSEPRRRITWEAGHGPGRPGTTPPARGRQGFQGPDGYVAELNANDLPGSHGVWSVSAWLIHRLDWAQHHDGPHG